MADTSLGELTGRLVFQYYDPSGPAAGDLFWSMATSRAGCYLADGADYSQTTDAELFAAYGTAFNTQINPTTGSAWSAPSAGRFRVPDMRGLYARGAGTASGATALAVGDYQTDQNKSHDHNLVTDQGTGTSGIRLATTSGTRGPSGGYVTSEGGNEVRVKSRGGNWFVRRFNPTTQIVGAGMNPLTPSLVQGYFDSGWLTLPTPTWNGTAPTSPILLQYRWIRTGRKVDLFWNLTYTNLGSSNSQVTWVLPGTAPVPSTQYNGYTYTGVGCCVATPGNSGDGKVLMDSTSGVHSIYTIATTAGAFRHARGQLTYATDS